jgi:hypothetical protein
MERQSTPTDGGRHGPDRFDDDPLRDPSGGDPLRDPSGSERAYDDPLRQPPRGRSPFDPTALFVLLDGLRRVVPRELEAQFTHVIREFLLALRALIDWYLERLDKPPREPRVEDIPID